MAPRKLPWLVEVERSQPKRQPAKHSRAVLPSPNEPVSDLDHTPVRHRPIYSLDDGPPSPTALSLQTSIPPPEIVYMKEGFDADDGYLMVEDEFFSTARLFTRHLHHEEYIRRKKLARSRMREAVENTPRAVDATTKQTGEVKVKLKAIDRSRSIKARMKDHMEEYDGPRDTHLSSLTSKTQLPSTDLSTLVKQNVRTKAASGFTQKRREPPDDPAVDVDDETEDEDEDEDEDSLDQRVRLPKVSSTSKAAKKLQGGEQEPRMHSGMFSRVSATNVAKDTTLQGAQPATRHRVFDFTRDPLQERPQWTSAASDFFAERKALLEQQEKGQGGS